MKKSEKMKITSNQQDHSRELIVIILFFVFLALFQKCASGEIDSQRKSPQEDSAFWVRVETWNDNYVSSLNGFKEFIASNPFVNDDLKSENQLDEEIRRQINGITLELDTLLK